VSAPEGVVTAWADQLEALKRSWAGVGPAGSALAAAWESRRTSMTDDVARLRAAGMWTHGPTDLLTVCGMHRWELTQSAALGWTCDPEARHGLGDGFLRSMLAATGDVPAITPPVAVDLEVTRDRSRADVVVRGSSWSLVVEVKVDAGEQERQCQRLYDDWVDEPDTRFVFLSPGGHPPISAFSAEARQAWRPMRWSYVLTSVRRAAAHGAYDAPGRPALDEWVRTLGRLYGRGAR
jgi:hypothetical protein